MKAKVRKSRVQKVDIIICPNLAGIGTYYVVTLAEWRNKRQRAAAIVDIEERIEEAMKVAKPR